MNNNLIPDDTKKALSSTPSLEDLTPEQKQKLNELIETLLQRVFTRVAHALTDEDIQKIEELDKKDETGQAIRYFLISKVPNFEAIIEEEANKLKAESETQI
jgi:hypothetical protein